MINETEVLGGSGNLGRQALLGGPFIGVMLLQVMVGHCLSSCPFNSFWLTRPATCSAMSPTITCHSCQRFTVMRPLSLDLPLESRTRATYVNCLRYFVMVTGRQQTDICLVMKDLWIIPKFYSLMVNIPINSVQDSHFPISLTTPVTFDQLSRLCFDFNLHFPNGYSFNMLVSHLRSSYSHALSHFLIRMCLLALCEFLIYFGY